MNKQVQVTREGFNMLKAELDELADVKRPKLVERLEHARNEGDLTENSDYVNAREELEFLDGRIDELKQVVGNAIILKSKGGNGLVSVGTTVTLDVNGNSQTFNIVGEWEADPLNKKISHESPLGKALVGRRVGDQVEVEAPAGKVIYKIVKIE